MPERDLAAALVTFDRVAVNLSRLSTVWREMSAMIPSGVAGPSDGARYDELARSLGDLAEGLPAIDGYRITARPLPPEEIIQNRFDAHEVGELSAHLQVERAIDAPGEQIAEYRHRFVRQRRYLVRERANELVVRIDKLLPDLTGRHPRDQSSVADDVDWSALEDAWRELLRLMGTDSLRGTRAGDMNRHFTSH